MARCGFCQIERRFEHQFGHPTLLLLTADVVLGDAPLTLQSVLYRTPQGKITVMQRRFGPSREQILVPAGGNFVTGN